MSLQARVCETFAPGGLLSRTVIDFQPREGQTEMATAVARALEEGGELVIEAGTGIGKTFSYLVPALLCGRPVLISTATKTLQDQLFRRDLPHLIKALGLPVRAALLKGRGSYLCIHRLDVARENLHLYDSVVARTVAKVAEWAQLTRGGDLAELPGFDERSPAIPLLTSSRDNCLGSQCPKFTDCHVNRARREALAADIVVINHHLFFADLVIRESGMVELLPTMQTVIFDEAHQLYETGVQFFGTQLTTGHVLDFARDMLTVGRQHALGLVDWAALAFATECVARDLRMLVGNTSPGVKLRWSGIGPDQLVLSEWTHALGALLAECTRAMQALETVSDIAPDLARMLERSKVIVDRLGLFSGACAVDAVRWLDVGTQLKLVEAPLDIASTFQSKFLKTIESEGSPRSLIFTSATLGDDARLSWFTKPCGLTHAEVLKVESPFDYARQAAIYVPENMLKPGDMGHSILVADLVARLAPRIGGRTLVLTTTLRALRTVGDALQRRFSDSKALEILMQGRQSKRELMERFQLGNQGARTGCILVASASFWQGVDMPGESLQLVVIDKLPFPPPSDPWVDAHARRLKSAGQSVFKHYYLPETAMTLKQGAGRLIRRESDCGVLVVCDTRLTSKGYGKRLLAALPPMKKLGSEIELIDALIALTRTSTTDPCWP